MKSFSFLFVCTLVGISSYAQQSCPSWGPYVSTDNLAKDSGVLMMADVRFTSNGIAPYTYASAVNFGIGLSGGYCGIQQAGFDENRKGNNIFSV